MRKQFSSIKQSLIEYENMLSTLSDQLESTEKKVGQAKYRLSLKEEIEAVLLDIQDTNHKRTVGMYETLLTQILKEVLGSTKKVKLDIYVKAGRPALDIFLDNDGQRESILQGSGGAVANVISAGLRFIALSRAGCRKFIVLDEADCWLATARVPYFANVIAKMGQELGVQTLVISHHPQDFFYDSANTIVQLNSSVNGVIAQYVKHEENEIYQSEDIESIELVNFMSHAHTNIPIGNGMTIIQAGNDVGKSVIVTAMSAISDGAFKSEYVRHDTEFSEVTLHFRSKESITCRRVLKTNTKDRYSISYRKTDSAGKVTHEGPYKDELPVWVTDMIGIQKQDDLDIQIGSQYTPIFLLDESPSVRAKILSVGGEINHIVTMQEKYKAKVTEDKTTVKSGEIEVGMLRKKVSILKALLIYTSDIDDALVLLDNIDSNVKLIQKVEVISNNILTKEVVKSITLDYSVPAGLVFNDVTKLNTLIKSLKNEQFIPADISSLPLKLELNDVARIDSVINELNKPMLPKLLLTVPIVPELKDNLVIDNLIAKIKNTQSINEFKFKADIPNLVLHDIVRLNTVFSNFSSIVENGKDLTVKQKEAKTKIENIEKEIHSIIQKSGGVCLHCGQTLKDI